MHIDSISVWFALARQFWPKCPRSSTSTHLSKMSGNMRPRMCLIDHACMHAYFFLFFGQAWAKKEGSLQRAFGSYVVRRSNRNKGTRQVFFYNLELVLLASLPSKKMFRQSEQATARAYEGAQADSPRDVEGVRDLKFVSKEDLGFFLHY